VLVAALAFGYPLAGLFRSSGGVVFTNEGLMRLVVFELLALAAILLLLRMRGWRLVFASPMSARGALVGVGLFVIAYASYVALYSVLMIVPGPDLTTAPELTVHVSLLPALLLVVVNPVFEEVLVVGYVLTALERFGPRIAIAASVVIRVSYHL